MASRAPLELVLTTRIDGLGTNVGKAAGITAASDGTLFISDTQTQEIVAFDSDGSGQRRIAGPGEGPGEFRGLRGDIVWIDGQLYAYDWRPANVRAFDAGGALVAEIPWPEGRIQWSRLLTSVRPRIPKAL